MRALDAPQLIIDVIDGRGGTFSLEGPEGKAFVGP
ncbi:DUF779 domain-containing protein [Leeia sp.]